jgi:hypothetical protein
MQQPYDQDADVAEVVDLWDYFTEPQFDAATELGIEDEEGAISPRVAFVVDRIIATLALIAFMAALAIAAAGFAGAL